MNERIRELAEQAGLVGPSSRVGNSHEATEKFAELIVRDCQDNLAWHGHDEAVSQLDWFKAHKLGIK